MRGREAARRATAAAAGRLPAGVRERARRAAGARRRPAPLTIVLVAEPGDDPRLADCLRSVLEQSRPAAEVLVCPVAGAESRTFPHGLRVLPATPTWQEAADAGGDAAGQELLWFVRGCDRLPVDAVTVMTEATAASGSDLVTGVLGQSGRPDPWLARAQRLAHAGTGARLAGDLTLGNHLFRTAHWRAGGRRLADVDSWLQSTAVASALRDARRADVVDRIVYLHTPPRGHRVFGAMPSPLPDLDAWTRRRPALDEVFAGTRLAEGRRLDVADLGLPRFLVDAERATEDQWQRLAGLARGVVDEGLPDGVAPGAASLLWLASRDRRSDVERLAVELYDLGDDLRAHPVGPDLVAAWGSVAVPDAVRRVPAAETPLLVDVRHARSDGDRLAADLFVRVPYLDLATVDHTITVTGPAGDAEVVLEPDPIANRWARDRFASAAEGAIRIGLSGPGEVRVRLVAGDLRREAAVRIEEPLASDDDAATLLGDVRLEDDVLVLSGFGDLGSVRLTGPMTDLPAQERHDTRIPLERDRFGRRVGLHTAPYRLTAVGGVGITAALRARLPLELPGERHRVQVTASTGGPLLLVGPPFADDEIGPYAQQRLREEYAARAGGAASITPGVFYVESFAGRSATDSPLAICVELQRRRPDAAVFWGIADHGESVPTGTTPLLVNSQGWYDVLATAELLVTSTEVEDWFVKRPDQLVVQTFHGYPSKAMGEVQWRGWELPPSRIRAMRHRSVDTWDLIISPTPEMTRHYREQYGYEGPAAEQGYPRDDALTATGADDQRRRTRDLLDIRDDQTAVLYAPTWRDDLTTRPRAAELSDHLDVARAARALGDGHVLLLRGHRFHASTTNVAVEGASRVVDVTDHPEVNDLILASDVAVLDYSSLRFDYALTGRPMVFLVPDLDDYSGGVRGFLFPFTESMPGPAARSTDEVVDEVRDVAALTARWADELAAFNAAYNPWQDGHAGARVVDRILELLGGR